MKKVCSLLGLLLVCSGVFFANTPALDLFKYDPAKMNGGTMYTYKVSDFEGESEMLTYVYLAGDNKIEYYQDYSALVNSLFSGKFDLHKTYFMKSSFEGGNPLGYLAVPNSDNYTKEQIDFSHKKIVGEAYHWDKNGKSKMTSFTYKDLIWPSYELSLCMFDFGLAMRHFTGTRDSTFDIGCTFASFNWDSAVRFDKEEEVNGVLCEKWVVKGRGALATMLGVKQELWFAKDSPFFELIKYKNHKYAGLWSNQQCVLLDTTAMTADQWKAHCDAITERAKTQFGY